MITAITLGHLVIGMALGARFHVIALAPALLVSIVTVTASAVELGAGLGWGAAMVISALSALQIGFLAGAALRDRMAGPLPRAAGARIRATR
jgi:hypothetical protein